MKNMSRLPFTNGRQASMAVPPSSPIIEIQESELEASMQETHLRNYPPLKSRKIFNDRSESSSRSSSSPSQKVNQRTPHLAKSPISKVGQNLGSKQRTQNLAVPKQLEHPNKIPSNPLHELYNQSDASLEKDSKEAAADNFIPELQQPSSMFEQEGTVQFPKPKRKAEPRIKKGDGTKSTAKRPYTRREPKLKNNDHSEAMKGDTKPADPLHLDKKRNLPSGSKLTNKFGDLHGSNTTLTASQLSNSASVPDPKKEKAIQNSLQSPRQRSSVMESLLQPSPPTSLAKYNPPKLQTVPSLMALDGRVVPSKSHLAAGYLESSQDWTIPFGLPPAQNRFDGFHLNATPKILEAGKIEVQHPWDYMGKRQPYLNQDYFDPILLDPKRQPTGQTPPNLEDEVLEIRGSLESPDNSNPETKWNQPVSACSPLHKPQINVNVVSTNSAIQPESEPVQIQHGINWLKRYPVKHKEFVIMLPEEELTQHEPAPKPAYNSEVSLMELEIIADPRPDLLEPQVTGPWLMAAANPTPTVQAVQNPTVDTSAEIIKLLQNNNSAAAKAKPQTLNHLEFKQMLLKNMQMKDKTLLGKRCENKKTEDKAKRSLSKSKGCRTQESGIPKRPDANDIHKRLGIQQPNLVEDKQQPRAQKLRAKELPIAKSPILPSPSVVHTETTLSVTPVATLPAITINSSRDGPEEPASKVGQNEGVIKGFTQVAQLQPAQSAPSSLPVTGVGSRYNTRRTNIIDFYDMGKQLGEGGNSIVREIFDRITREKFALKTTKPKCEAKYISREFNMRWQNSLNKIIVNMLRSIQHENIIEAFRVFTSANHSHLVLKFFDGLNLNDYLRKLEKKRLSEGTARSILHEIFKTVKYCHDKNLCHRDLKAENIMIEPGTLKIKIIDFAYADYVTEGDFVSTYCGTPSYMSPEILRKEPHCPRKDDIWALGIMSWRIVTGQLPFQANGSRELYKKILEAAPPMHKLKDLSPQFKDLVGRMLEKKAAARPSMTEILEHGWFKVALGATEVPEVKSRWEAQKSGTKQRLTDREMQQAVDILTSNNASPGKGEELETGLRGAKKSGADSNQRLGIPGQFSPRAVQSQTRHRTVALVAEGKKWVSEECGEDRESVQVVGVERSPTTGPGEFDLAGIQEIEEIEEDEVAVEGHNSLHDRSITESLCQKELGSLEIFTQLADFPTREVRPGRWTDTEGKCPPVRVADDSSRAQPRLPPIEICDDISV